MIIETWPNHLVSTQTIWKWWGLLSSQTVLLPSPGALISQQDGYADVSSKVRGYRHWDLASIISLVRSFMRLTWLCWNVWLPSVLVQSSISSFDSGYCSWFLTQTTSNSLVRLFWLFGLISPVLRRKFFTGWPYHDDSYCRTPKMRLLRSITVLTPKTILDHVNLTIREGDFITILGGNGAGKSTLFNVIAGTPHVDQWSDFHQGWRCYGLPAEKRAKYPLMSLQDPKMGTAPSYGLLQKTSWLPNTVAKTRA